MLTIIFIIIITLYNKYFYERDKEREEKGYREERLEEKQIYSICPPSIKPSVVHVSCKTVWMDCLTQDTICVNENDRYFFRKILRFLSCERAEFPYNHTVFLYIYLFVFCLFRGEPRVE